MGLFGKLVAIFQWVLLVRPRKDGTHHRVGHLFQNRYKSIVCEEDPYLQELVRYIHLNPLRVGAVADIEALDRYPWSGHSVLMGVRAMTEQNASEVLAYFGSRIKYAREAYRCFVIDGAGQGRRDELCGGGLRRVVSTGVEEQPQVYDERVLGSGEFVQQLIGKPETFSAETEIMSISVLVSRVAETFGITPEEIRGPGRAKAVAVARSLISYLGYRRMGHSGEAVARVLGITRFGVCRRAVAGEKLFRSEGRVREMFPGYK